MRLIPTLILVPGLALAACNPASPPADTVATNAMANTGSDNAMMANAGAAASPMIKFAGGDGTALGGVTLADSAAGLVMTFAATGMPAGTHGIHLHAVGKCDGPKFESAGSHWNPASKMHGKDNPQGAHMGDLPNVTVAGDGTNKEVLTAAGVTMTALQDADGSALVIHVKADDYKTDPSGNSGDRIACAVIAPPR